MGIKIGKMEWIPLSSIIKLEHKEVKPSDLINGLFHARYAVHRNIGRERTGYKDVIGFDVRLPNWGYKYEWAIVDETRPITSPMGYHKQYSNESIFKLINDAATKDFFGTIEYADFHHIEVLMTDKEVVLVN